MNPTPQKETQPATESYNKLPKPASAATIQAWEKVMQDPYFSDRRDYASATRGFKATYNLQGQLVRTPVDQVIIGQPGSPAPVWNMDQYRFLRNDPAPLTVNPSLWRQAQLNLNNGIFEVTKRTYTLPDKTQVTRGIYQVRAFDLSNMTIVETNHGIIVIDPLISQETAAKALQLYRDLQTTSQPLPVKAVIYTHSHIDHYGGVNGVISSTAGVDIFAPEGFLDHAVSENVYAGSCMNRRALYMYGTLLQPGDKSQVDSGLGKTTSTGQSGLVPPTITIENNLEQHFVDGVEIVFQLAEDTEAPSEILFYFPQFKALCAAEDMTHNLHNLYSLRGAQVRNAAAWWKVINDAIQLFGDKTDVIFAQHHWPMWKDEPEDQLVDEPNRILFFLKKQRDLYKYIHDQSLRLLNHGRTMLELSEMMVLPESLTREWYDHGYYGTVNHDSKAVYQRYIGWYDANPANLHKLPPVQASQRYVQYMGGPDNVLTLAKAAFDEGDYRWVAEVVNHVIFADPDSTQVNPQNPTIANAKLLQADALEQMGYQAESGPWRNVYLMGAHELRHAVSHFLKPHPLSMAVMSAMTLDQYFDYMGLRFNAFAAQVKPGFIPRSKINWIVMNPGALPQFYALELIDYTLPYTSYGKESELPFDPDCTVTLERQTLNEITTNPNLTMTQAFEQAVAEHKIVVKGDQNRVTAIFDLLDIFPANFNIVTPTQIQDAVSG